MQHIHFPFSVLINMVSNSKTKGLLLSTPGVCILYDELCSRFCLSETPICNRHINVQAHTHSIKVTKSVNIQIMSFYLKPTSYFECMIYILYDSWNVSPHHIWWKPHWETIDYINSNTDEWIILGPHPIGIVYAILCSDFLL